MMHRFQNLKKHHIGVGLVLAVAIILFWRGVWQLADMFFFPESPGLSNFLSLVLGLAVIYIVYRYLDKDAADHL